MARIKTYALDGQINLADKIIGTDGTPGSNFGKTKNYSIQSLKSFLSEGSSTDLLNKSVILTPEQILTLNGGGTVEIIPAPGADKIISVMNTLIHLDFGTAAYNFAVPSGSLSDGVGLVMGTVPLQNDNAVFINNLNSASDTYFIADPLNAGPGTIQTPNTPLNILATAGVTVSQGDSPIKFSILYREILIP